MRTLSERLEQLADELDIIITTYPHQGERNKKRLEQAEELLRIVSQVESIDHYGELTNGP